MKKFYLLTIIFALLGMNQAWANTAKIEGSEFDNGSSTTKTWSHNHVTYTLSGTDISYTGTLGGYMTAKANNTYTISWVLDDNNSTISVSHIELKCGNPNVFGGSYDVYINDTKAGNVGWAATDARINSDLVEGNDGSITLKATRTADIYFISITYTVTPNSAPSVVNTEETINVTLDPSNLTENTPQTVVFTTSSAFENDLEFEVSPNSGFGHDKGTFYATVAGTYTAKARVAAKADCHEESAWSDVVTITVNRLNQTLKWTDEASINTNMVVEAKQKINATSTSGRVVTYTSSNTDVLTVDAEGNLEAVAEGNATITVSRNQDDQYNAAVSISKEFTVRSKITPHFVPVDFATLDSCGIYIEGAKTIELNNVSDGLEGKFTATPSNDKISVSREGNVLTISALKLGEATLTLNQEETGDLNPLSKTYKITVVRKANSIKVNGATEYSFVINPSHTLNIAFTSDNTELESTSIVAEQLSGDDFAVLTEGVIITNYREGEATWKVSQPQSDNFEAAEITLTINVEKAAEKKYIYESDGTEQKCSEFGEKWLEQVGFASRLIFEAKKTTSSSRKITPKVYVNNDWSNLSAVGGSLGNNTYNGDEGTYWTRDVDANISAIKFEASNDNDIRVRNVKVEAIKGYVNAEDLDVLVDPSQSISDVLTVEYAIVNGGDLHVYCDNPLFTFGEGETAGYVITGSNETVSNVNIPVHFTASAVPGTVEVANIIIYNGVYRKDVKITTTVDKFTPVIETAPQATDIKLGQTLADSYLDNGEASVNGTFAWQDDTIEPDSTGNKKYNVIFTPNDTENYNTVIIEVEVRVTDQETAVFNTESGLKATKILRDGQVLILRDGKVYNLNGMEVR